MKASKELDIEFKEAIFMNYKIEEWVHDLKIRVSQLKIEEEKKSINLLDARINRLVSTEQRRELELKSIMEDMKS